MQDATRFAHMGEGQDSPATSAAKKDFQRSFKACDGCRTKKVKCDLGSLDAPSEPPCSRCKREMRQCLFTMSTRGRGSKTRSTRAQAFGAHHLAKSHSPNRLYGDDQDDSTAAIDALAGAALAALPDTNPRLHSTRNDVSVSQLDPTDAPSIGMIYGVPGTKRLSRSSNASRHETNDQPSKRTRLDRQHGRPSATTYTSGTDTDELSDGGTYRQEGRRTFKAALDPRSQEHVSPAEIGSDALQRYASVGLQNSRDALRVLAGVAVETRESTTSRATSESEERHATLERNKEDLPTQTRSPERNAPTSHYDYASPPAPLTSLPAADRSARDSASLLARPVTPPALKHRYGWSKFEPVRLKLIKRSEARYFLNFFSRRMHAFAPHCSPHLLNKSPEALSELVSREPILLGAMLSVASRYEVQSQNAHLLHPDTFHRKISKWTQEKISRSFFLPGSHTIGTIEALLILSEWATLDLHDRRASSDASSDSDDDANDEEVDRRDVENFPLEVGTGTVPTALNMGPSASDTNENGQSSDPTAEDRSASDRKDKRRSYRSPQRPARLDLRESEKFDDTAWMLTGTALRLAERLDLQNVATYGGISSAESASRLNAERRMRIWMSSVHADCHLSVRLGRRISSPGLMAPFMNLVRDRTHPFLIRSNASSSIGLSDTSLTTGTPRAWIAFRAHSELLQIVFRTCENLYRSRAVTERLLEDEDFVPALKSIRDDLDEWANWTQPRIEPIRDMTSLRLRVEYHYARLYANGISLDSLKRGLGTTRPHNRVQYHSGSGDARKGRNEDADAPSGSMAIGFSTHPAYPFVREALAAAQSLIRILTVELDSMMCAPARWFLLLVMAAVFCVKATAVSDAILPLNRCAQSLQQVIAALTKAAPDGVHLANRYSLYLRQLAKQLVLTDAKARRRSNAAASRQSQKLARKGDRLDLQLHGNEKANKTSNVTSGVQADPRRRNEAPGQTPSSSNMPPMSSSTYSQEAQILSVDDHASISTHFTGVGGGTGTGWSTGDVLGGEVDPDSFLKWLDEQTMAASPMAASTWLTPSSAAPMTSLGSTAHLHLPVAAGSTQSPLAHGSNPNNLGELAYPGGPDRRQTPSSEAAQAGVDNGLPGEKFPGGASPANGPATTPSTDQDDLLTRMWLNDALADLASAGLDMPFL